MTEDEAKTKWCPMGRLFFSDAAINDPSHNHIDCIGSACMMFRKSVVVDESAELAEVRTENGLLAGYRKQMKEIFWCGLAGKP